MTPLPRRKKIRYEQGDIDRLVPIPAGGLDLCAIPGKGRFRDLSLLHVSMPAGYRHESLYHKRTHEWFYVLEGRTTVTVGGKPVRLKPGSFVYIAPGVPHIVGTGKQPVRVLALFSPPMNMKKPDICLVHSKK